MEGRGRDGERERGREGQKGREGGRERDGGSKRERERKRYREAERQKENCRARTQCRLGWVPGGLAESGKPAAGQQRGCWQRATSCGGGCWPRRSPGIAFRPSLNSPQRVGLGCAGLRSVLRAGHRPAPPCAPAHTANAWTPPRWTTLGRRAGRGHAKSAPSIVSAHACGAGQWLEIGRP